MTSSSFSSPHLSVVWLSRPRVKDRHLLLKGRTIIRILEPISQYGQMEVFKHPRSLEASPQTGKSRWDQIPNSMQEASPLSQTDKLSQMA